MPEEEDADDTGIDDDAKDDHGVESTYILTSNVFLMLQK